MVSFSNEKPSDKELTIEDQALLGTARLIEMAADRLDIQSAELDILAVEVRKVPFGRFGEGFLNASTTNDNGLLSTTVEYQSTENNDDSFQLAQPAFQSYWTMKNRRNSDPGTLKNRRISTLGALLYLDANWPQQLIDNSAVRHAASLEQPTSQDVHNLIDKELRTHSPFVSEKKTYTYQQIYLDEINNDIHSASFSLTTTTDQDGFRKILAKITQPYELDDVPVELHTSIAIDDVGTPELHTWLNHPLTQEHTNVPIENVPHLCEEFENFLEGLLTEKTQQS